ncbi:MAG: class I SAM-dependent methyltransferase [Acidobacteriota bacterium]|nr:class I SAM-dependent methyltransferase [Acidobacteriota bacterium]
MKMTNYHDTSALTDEQIQTAWEDAYTRFETPEEEIKKFVGRLNKLGQKEWQRDAQIVDIFSGRCNGIRALEKLGFTNLEGIDISPNLLSKYRGEAKLYTADCRQLPFEDSSRDIIIVQGGLHHLPKLPEDLEQTLAEIKRVLRPTGRFVMVEPWETPFLRLIHFLSERKLIRAISNKFDAFDTMTRYEAKTYFQWINASSEVLGLLDKYFISIYFEKGMGKLFYIGSKK